jgi:hypothetical protein
LEIIRVAVPADQPTVDDSHRRQMKVFEHVRLDLPVAGVLIVGDVAHPEIRGPWIGVALVGVGVLRVLALVHVVILAVLVLEEVALLDVVHASRLKSTRSNRPKTFRLSTHLFRFARAETPRDGVPAVRMDLQRTDHFSVDHEIVDELHPVSPPRREKQIIEDGPGGETLPAHLHQSVQHRLKIDFLRNSTQLRSLHHNKQFIWAETCRDTRDLP